MDSLDVKLINSSIDGDIEGVIAAVAKGGRVKVRCPEGFTPLHLAAQNGHTDVCGLLLAYGSNVNEMLPDIKQTSLHIAAG